VGEKSTPALWSVLVTPLPSPTNLATTQGIAVGRAQRACSGRRAVAGPRAPARRAAQTKLPCTRGQGAETALSGGRPRLRRPERRLRSAQQTPRGRYQRGRHASTRTRRRHGCQPRPPRSGRSPHGPPRGAIPLRRSARSRDAPVPLADKRPQPVRLVDGSRLPASTEPVAIGSHAKPRNPD